MSNKKNNNNGSKKSGKAFAKSQESQPNNSNNQKKLPKLPSRKEQSQNNNYTKFSSKVFRESTYMPQFIKEVPNNSTLCKCMKCQNPETKKMGKIIIVNNLYSHLKSKQHKSNTPENKKRSLRSF